jgi:hypothetical protein
MEMKFQERHITPKVGGDTVIDKILLASKFNDCAVYAQTMATVIQESPTWDFHKFELLFRELDLGVYLVAVTKDRAMPGQVPFNLKTGKEAPYWLWICVNGSEEAKAYMSEFSLPSYNENLERLKDTGILVVEEKK